MSNQTRLNNDYAALTNEIYLNDNEKRLKSIALEHEPSLNPRTIQTWIHRGLIHPDPQDSKYKLPTK